MVGQASAILLLWSPCDPAGEAAATSNSAPAQLVIYRPKSLALALSTATFSVDGAEVAKLSNGSYAALMTPAGKHVLTVTWNWGAKTLSKGIYLEPGQTHFYRLESDTRYFLVPGVRTETEWFLSRRTQEEADYQIFGLKKQPASTLANEEPPTPPADAPLQ